MSSNNYKHRNSTLLLTPFADGSRGDEALLKSSLGHFNSKVSIVCTFPWSKHSKLVGEAGRKVYVPGVIYGLFPLSFISAIQFLWISQRYERIIFVGADLLDGVYWIGPSLRRLLLLESAANLGGQGHLIGFSWPIKSEKVCLEAIVKLSKKVEVVPRDEESAKRLVREDVRVVGSGADIAFGLTHSESTLKSEAFEWANRQLLSSKKIIAIGLNGSHSRRKSDVESLLQILEIDPNEYSLLLIPMDERLLSGDRFSINILESVARARSFECFTLGRDESVESLVSLLTKSHCTLTFRMHLAVLSFLASCPSIGVDYNDKFQGLYRLFGLENLVLQRNMLVNRLPQLLQDLLANADSYRGVIKTELPKVREKSWSPTWQ